MSGGERQLVITGYRSCYNTGTLEQSPAGMVICQDLGGISTMQWFLKVRYEVRALVKREKILSHPVMGCI